MTTFTPTGPPDTAPALYSKAYSRSCPSASGAIRQDWSRISEGLSKAGLGCEPFWTAIRPKLNGTGALLIVDALPGPIGHPLVPRIRPEPVQNSGFGIRRDCPRQPVTHSPRPSPASDPAKVATDHRLSRSNTGSFTMRFWTSMRPEQTTTRPAAQVSHAIAPTPPPNTCADPSRAVQNPS